VYVLQNQKREEEQRNLTERLERARSAREKEAQKQKSLGIIERTRRFFTGTPVNIENKGIPQRITLRPSNRQKQLNEKKQNSKKGGTRRKQKRSNPTRRVKRQSKPVYPSCK
jgi:hypothetical protein